MPFSITPTLKTTAEISERYIGRVQGKNKGPTVIFFAGIHGNEPAGIKALKQVFLQFKGQEDRLNGQCFGIVGNLKALKKSVRFLDEDLNRIWLPQHLDDSERKKQNAEGQEMWSLYDTINHVIATNDPPFYFVDLHTTSGDTVPFIVMNDSLLNRRFTKNYPLPIILGIEEYLTGALLSYINELGYVSVGFESGQHDSKEAVTNAKYFVDYTLALTGFEPVDIKEIDRRKILLSKSHPMDQRFYEIYYQHLIHDTPFKMLPGFENFQKVAKGKQIALNGDGLITTTKERQLFMPLYQDKGYEGFYFIRSIAPIFLGLSRFFRKLGLDSLLAKLPGVAWKTPQKRELILDKRIARYFAKSFFHLMGYRAREDDSDHLVLQSRERHSKTKAYKMEKWY